MHGILSSKKPRDIFKNIVIPERFSKDIRYNADPRVKNIFHSFIKLYNQLPGEFRGLNKQGFKI